MPAGTTAVVFFNGGGAGAVAANVFNNAFFDSLRLGGVSVTAILDEDNMASDSATALATQQSIKAYVDAQVGANNELSEILANGNTSGGNDIQMTTTDEVQFRDTALKISSSVDGQLDIAADVELEIVAPTLDINASTAVTIDTTTMTMTGSVNVVGDLDVDNLNINGNSIISTNTNGNIAITPNGTGEVDISKVDIDGGTIDGTVIGGSTPAAISGTTGTFSGDVSIADKIVHTGDTNTAIRFPAADTVTVETAGTERLRITSSGNVGIGETLPQARLHVANAQGGQTGRILFDANVTSEYEARIDATDVGLEFTARSNSRGFAFNIGTTPTERLRITSSGNVGIGETLPQARLHVANAQGGQTGRILFDANVTSEYEARIDATDVGLEFTARSNSRGFAFNIGATPTERLRITSSGNVGIGTSSPSEKLSVTGNVTISGSLSKGSGSFKIDHPIKPETHHLVHSFIEGPQADNIYRGKVALVAGAAAVNLDEAGRMTENTFVALNGNVQCFTTNEDGWTAVRGKVEGNILTIEAQDAACTDTVSWLVIGERHDQHMIDANWTDEQGRVITEPAKETAQ